MENEENLSQINTDKNTIEAEYVKVQGDWVSEYTPFDAVSSQKN